MLSPLQLIRRLRALLGRRRFDSEVEEEIRFHLEMEAAKNAVGGMAQQAATSEARRRFGSVAVAREEVRDAHGLTPVDDLRRDLRFAVRSLRRTPGYTAVALLTLALGIGGTVAVFTVVNGTLLQPLPFRTPDRIVTVSGVTRGSLGLPKHHGSRVDPQRDQRPRTGSPPAGSHAGGCWHRNDSDRRAPEDTVSQ